LQLITVRYIWKQ